MWRRSCVRSACAGVVHARDRMWITELSDKGMFFLEILAIKRNISLFSNWRSTKFTCIGAWETVVATLTVYVQWLWTWASTFRFVCVRSGCVHVFVCMCVWVYLWVWVGVWICVCIYVGGCVFRCVLCVCAVYTCVLGDCVINLSEHAFLSVIQPQLLFRESLSAARLRTTQEASHYACSH